MATPSSNVSSSSQGASRSAEGASSLRQAERERSRQDVIKLFDGIEACCGELDSAVKKLRSSVTVIGSLKDDLAITASKLRNVLLAASVLDKRSNSLWATRDLNLSRRLLVPRVLSEVGTAFLGLGNFIKFFPRLERDAVTAVDRLSGLSSQVRRTASVVRQDVLDSIDSGAE